MTARTTLLIGVTLIGLTGLIHLVEAPEQLEEETYIGVLFILNGLGAALSAFWLLRGQERNGWSLGVLVAGGAIVAFVLSRTVGLPSFKEEEWELLGLISIVIEGAFVALALSALRGPAAATERRR